MRVPATPLFLQALGLVVAALIAADIAAVVVMLNLTPPTPDIYAVSDVVHAARLHGSVQTLDGRDLDVHLAPNPPERITEGRRRLKFRAGVAQLLNLPISDVVVTQRGPHIVALSAAQQRLDARPSVLRETPILVGDFQVAVKQPDGLWLLVEPQSTFGIDPWQQRFLLVLAIAAVSVSPLAWWFARRLAAPIAALAAGAERLGRDPSAPRLDIRGSAEVTSAVKAFNEMQERLRHYVDDRTGMIGAIAHDLRTPLTRMRFRIEAAPDEVRTKLATDIDQMEAMVSATMAFVRDASKPRERVKLEIASLVETIMDEAAETGADSAAEVSRRVVVDGDPVALRRLITNLVDNALKFGSAARGRVYAEDGMAIVEIDDDGPGIAEDQIERAFEPFHRLESSRSRDTGGIGLGLAVVRAIARGHGGDVTLNSKMGGGLSARVRLPLAVSTTGAVRI
jgi:signal transduction histidine kinase